jgi:membrane protein YqaA with SNARE-associated domain
MHGFVVWLQEVLVPMLGTYGIFVVAFVDSSFLSIPEVNDIFVVTSSAAQPGRAWLFVLITTLGSVAGCSALWLVGKRGGEPLLVRKFGPERVERTRQTFRRWDVLALAVPALLPPPIPFKIFVFSAGVFGVPYPRFLLTVGLARGLRYGTWGVAGAVYGPAAMESLKAFDGWFQANSTLVLVPCLVALIVILAVRLRRRTPPRPPASSLLSSKPDE